MILIRLKKRSFGDHMSYAIVVTAKQEAPSTGNFVEKLGHYKPIVDNWSNKYVFIDFDRLKHWVERGASMDIKLFVLMKPLIAYHTMQLNLRLKNN